MRNGRKKCLAILLSVALLLNVNVVTYASENNEQANKLSENEIDVLSQQGQEENNINESSELKEKK